MGRKLSLTGDGATSRTVIIDGQSLVTTPLRILVSIATGQLRITIETVYTTGRNPLGDGLALHAIGLMRFLIYDIDISLPSTKRNSHNHP